MEISPPVTYFTARKIGENTFTRPHFTLEKFSILVTAEVVMLDTLFVNGVVFIDLGARVDNGDQVQALLMQVVCHLCGVSQLLSVPSEATEPTPIVYIAPDIIA